VSQTAFLAANGGVRVAGNTDKILIKVNTSALARWQSLVMPSMEGHTAWEHYKRGLWIIFIIGFLALATFIMLSVLFGSLLVVLIIALPRAWLEGWVDDYYVPGILIVTCLLFPYVLSATRSGGTSVFEEIMLWRRPTSTSASVASNATKNKPSEVDAAFDIVEKYGAVLSRSSRKHPLSSIRDVSELPYPKVVIKTALQALFRWFSANEALLDVCKTGYLLLSDFQELTEEQRNALVEGSKLTAGAGSPDDVIFEQAMAAASLHVCLKPVEARSTKERLELVQDLKSIGLWDEAREAKAMAKVIQDLKSKGIIEGDESWLPAQSTAQTASDPLRTSLQEHVSPPLPSGS
jgi:primosomal protein N'